MSTTRPIRTIVVAAASLLVLAGCGSGPGAANSIPEASTAGQATGSPAPGTSSPGGNASAEEFCDYVRSIDTSGNPADVLPYFDELLERAPDEELRAALVTLQSVVTKLAAIDPADEEALLEATFELVFGDPVISAAFVAFENYTVEVCGMKPVTDGGDTEPFTWGEPEDEAGRLRDAVSAAVTAALELQDPSGRIDSTSVTTIDAASEIGLDITTSRRLDAGALCRVALDVLAGAAPDGSYAVELTVADKVIARGSVAEGCTVS